MRKVFKGLKASVVVFLKSIVWPGERWKLRKTYLIIKPTSFTNFSNLFLKWNSTYFGQFLCPSSGVSRCTHSNSICHNILLTACEQDQDGNPPSWSCSQAVSKPVWHITSLSEQWNTSDDGHRKCPKHVEFYFKINFEKLVHLFGFIIRHLSRCTVKWTSNTKVFFVSTIKTQSMDSATCGK
jgi:hypothetical protein